MSFSFAIDQDNMDIQLKGSAVGIVSGIDKLYQDLSIWLRERYRTDRFHLGYGSVLDNFIGGVIDDATVAEVRSEVMRVLQNYQSRQAQILRSAPQSLSSDEILLSVDNISAKVSYDTVNVLVQFTTAYNTPGRVGLTVGV